MKKVTESKTVLMIEDDDGVRAILSVYLENAGFQVFEAADAQQAMEVWHEQLGMVDIVLSDVLLLNSNPEEAIARFRTERPNLKVILMSGGIPAPSKNYAEAFGAFEFLKKPFTPGELFDAIEQSKASIDPCAEVSQLDRIFPDR